MIKQDYIIIPNDYFKDIENTIVLSFSGGGWLGLCYYIGILEYLLTNKIIEKYNFITLGASAGSLAAFIILFLKFNINHGNQYELIKIKNKFYNFILSLNEQCFLGIPINCEQQIILFLKSLLENLKNKEIFFDFLKDKLFISISEFTFFKIRNKLVNPIIEKELIQSLLNSCKLPFMITLNLKNYFNKFDGSFTNNQPILKNNEVNYKKIIKINCIYKYNADICPSQFINPIYIVKKPSIDIINKIIKIGKKDINFFFKKIY